MARTGITYEDVRQAAESLLGRGLNPTIQRVREVLGTGSNTTISEHLKSWQQQLAETPKVILPPSAPEAVTLGFDAFWKIAVHHAEVAFDEQRTLATQAVAVAEQARDHAIEEQRQLTIDIEQLRRQLQTTKSTARDLADRLLVEQERRATAEIAIQAAEERIRTAVETVAQIRAETEARVMQLETVLQQARSDRQQQEVAARQQLEIEQRRNESNEHRWALLFDQQSSDWMSERQAFATERMDWKNREETWQARLENQQRDLSALGERLAVTHERQHHLATELQHCHAALQEREIQHLDAIRSAEQLRGELKAALALQDTLRQQLEQAQPARSGFQNQSDSLGENP